MTDRQNGKRVLKLLCYSENITYRISMWIPGTHRDFLRILSVDSQLMKKGYYIYTVNKNEWQNSEKMSHIELEHKAYIRNQKKALGLGDVYDTCDEILVTFDYHGKHQQTSL